MDMGDLVLRPDLLAAGYTDEGIRRLLRSADLTSVRPGGYVVGGLPSEAATAHVLRVRTTVPKLAESAVISHTSAALLHGLPTWGQSLARVHVTRNRRASGRRGTQVHVHAAPFDEDEVVVIAGITVTSAPRTVLDIARSVPLEQAVVLADEALRKGLVDEEGLLVALERAGRRPGVPAARRVLAFADGRSESVGESRSRIAIHRAGLPAPDLQVEVRDDHGRLIARCDFGWREHGLVGEFDGRVKYKRFLRPGQEPGDVVFAEKIREDRVRSTGLDVVRWTWADLDDFGPTASQIGRAVERPGRHVA